MAESNVQVTAGVGTKLHTNQRTIGANTVEDEYVVQGIPFFASYVSTANAVSTATALSHLVQIMAGGTLNVYVTRIRIWQFNLATTAAIGRLNILRLSTAGTGGTANSVPPLDSTDAAAGATHMSLPTAKGTEGSAIYNSSAAFIQTTSTAGENTLLFDWGIGRETDRTKPLRIPAGTANGICVKMIDAIAAATVQVSIELFEANY